jgi:hypothetical protein
MKNLIVMFAEWVLAGVIYLAMLLAIVIALPLMGMLAFGDWIDKKKFAPVKRMSHKVGMLINPFFN